MDNRILDALRHAPTIDLYALSMALDRMMSDPARILEVRRHLHPGAQVMYFNYKRDGLSAGRVLQLSSTSVTVQDDATRAHWKLPYAAIVADPALRAEATPVPLRPAAVDLPVFKVGDTVSFADRHLRDRTGTIVRVNKKTCSVMCDGENWVVSPVYLRKIIDL